MEAERNLHTFHQFPVRGVLRLGAGADRRARNGRRARGFRLFGQADARAAVPAGAGDAVDCRNVRVRRGRSRTRRVRHQHRCADRGVDVLLLTRGACRDRRCRGSAWVGGDDGDRRRGGNRERESTGKDQSSCWELEGRHRHAFCNLLTGQLLPATLPRSTGNERTISDDNGAFVPFLSASCQVAVARLGSRRGRRLIGVPARAVMCKSSDASESERGGPPWRVPT